MTSTTFPRSGDASESGLAPVAGSVWLTGQVCSRDQRRGRYTPASMAHPGKMLPAIARHLITTYTHPGDLVFDPMAGIATTIVEAMHLGRRGVGVEYEPRWAQLGDDNTRLALAQGASGGGEILRGDARHLTALVPPDVRGRVALVITSPPYGPSTHGHVRTPGPRHGKVRKLHHRYGNAGNLAYAEHDQLAAAFTTILTNCAALLAPGGHIAITARPYRRHGELIDIPGMVIAAGANAGLSLVDRCVALIAGVRDGHLIPRASFFQLRNVRAALADGDPQWLVGHEDVLIFASELSSARSVEPPYSQRRWVPGQPQELRHHSATRRSGTGDAHGVDELDVFTPSRVDRRLQPAPPTDVHPNGGATAPLGQPVRDAERTTDPCPRNPLLVPRSVRTDATDHRRSADHDTSPPQLDPSGNAGQR